MITEHYMAVYLSLFLVTLSLGFWLGCKFSISRIKRLKERLNYARFVP